MSSNYVIEADDEKKVIHTTHRQVSYVKLDFESFKGLCDKNNIDKEVQSMLWAIILKEECEHSGDLNFTYDEETDADNDEPANIVIEELINNYIEEAEEAVFGTCKDCDKVLGPTVNIKIIQKESIEKTICDECCPDKKTMKAEGWTEVDADSDDDDESVEGCEQPYPETKDHRPETKIDLVPDIKAPEAVDWFQSMGVVKDFFKDRKIVTDELEAQAKEVSDELYLKYRMAKINAIVITEVAKAFDDLSTITENSNIFVRKSVVNRMEELMSTLCGICKSP